MKRKVVKHGPATYIVSLPSKWVKEFKIEKGSELEVEEFGDKLLVTLGREKLGNELSVDVSGLHPRLVDRLLVRAYQKGYDRVSLKYDNPEVFKVVQERIYELMGFEVIEQKDDSCLIQSITSNVELDFNESLKKAFVSVIDMGKICYDSFLNKDEKSLGIVSNRDSEVNKFCYFCLRKINKGHHPVDPLQLTVTYYLIEVLEHVGDRYKVLAKNFGGLRSRNKKQILDLLGSTNELMSFSYRYFYNPSKKTANEVFDLYKDVTRKVFGFYEKGLNKTEISILFLLRNLAVLIYRFTAMRLDLLRK